MVTLMPTEETVNLLYEIGFRHIGYTAYEDSIALSAGMVEVTSDGLRKLADLPGFVALCQGDGAIVLTLRRPAIAKLKED